MQYFHSPDIYIAHVEKDFYANFYLDCKDLLLSAKNSKNDPFSEIELLYKQISLTVRQGYRDLAAASCSKFVINYCALHQKDGESIITSSPYVDFHTREYYTALFKARDLEIVTDVDLDELNKT